MRENEGYEREKKDKLDNERIIYFSCLNKWIKVNLSLENNY